MKSTLALLQLCLALTPLALGIKPRHVKSPYAHRHHAADHKKRNLHKNGGLHSACFTKQAISLVQHEWHNGKITPGAGMNREAEPFGTVYKDGFMHMSCIRDAMFYRGDKFGDHKVDYSLKDRSNVTIVHYEDFVAKEDRKQMTHEVCFDFCRTMEEMNYFGLVNGRGCYCAPFVKQEAGDSSDCDKPCDGQKTTMCGGKVKSDIFSMHMCNDGALTFSRTAMVTYETKLSLETLADKVIARAKSQHELATDLQKDFGNAGDSAASDLMQQAKKSAGTATKAAEAGKNLGSEIDEVLDKVEDLIGLDVEDVLSQADDMEVRTPSGAAAAELAHRKKSELDEIFVNSMHIDLEEFMDFTVADKAEALEKQLKKLNSKAMKQDEELDKAYLKVHPESSAMFNVVQGPCEVKSELDGANQTTKSCVTSSNFDNGDGYEHGCWTDEDAGCEGDGAAGFHNGLCKINMVHDAKIKVEAFEVEGYYDYLSINGEHYDGDNEHIQDLEVVAKGTIYWHVDGTVNEKGWKVCAESDACSATYFPAMYFVDKEFVSLPSTCTGDLVADPMHVSYETCACQCDAHFQNCVGFSHFPGNDGGLCFLFSNFKSLHYYTGCTDSDEKTLLEMKSSSSAFLGKKHNSTKQPSTVGGKVPTCAAKGPKFFGTTLKPDASGKCEQCMKTVTKADRCYK